MGKGNKPRNQPPSSPSQIESHPESTLEVSVEQYRAGPIPPPSEFREYDQLIPNGADRIMAQWESETKHRHTMQSRAQWFTLIEQLAARFFALLFAGGCLAVVACGISQDATIPASIIGGVMIVAGINAFLQIRK